MRRVGGVSGIRDPHTARELAPSCCEGRALSEMG